ncbi:O-antigen ligase family protein [Alteraurantiacibacter aquimixticola]|uniref:O-antigen ligase family protein n=1 Tax=Alteraurantiacibacter aquimixticola TaxID=2489173 RepID=UPI00145B0EB9|nr:O-antigen ligase family protein [Alteraurantiacibacter aquimixticola]
MAESGPTSEKALPTRVLAMAAFFWVLLLPPQFNAQIGTVVLPAYRILLFAVMLLVIITIIRGQLRWTLPDTLVCGIGLWIIIALFATMDVETAIQGGGSQFIDIVISYLCGRIAIRSPRDFRIFLVLIAPALGFIALMLALESITHSFIVQPLASAVTGQPVRLGAVERLGLMRAPGPFPHSILAGIFFGSFLPLYALSGLRGWPKITGFIASLCSFFTISSAALLALLAGFGLIFYSWLTEQISGISWRLFVLACAVVMFVLELATKSGAFVLLVRYAALNSVSSYNRILIWNHGSASVRNHPFFGVGYNDWERPFWMLESVDNYWLWLAIQYGALPSILLLAATVVAVYRLGRAASHSPRADRHLRMGVAISYSIFALGIISVAIWLSALVWFYALLGITVSLGMAHRSDRQSQTAD